MWNQAEFSGKRNVAIALTFFLSVALTVSSLSLASTPSSQQLGAVLANLGKRPAHPPLTGAQIAALTSGTSQSAGQSSGQNSGTSLNLAAFGIKTTQTYKGAIPMTGAEPILKNMGDTVARLNVCLNQANPKGTGPINDDCLLPQYKGSGVEYAALPPKIKTNWDINQPLPDQFNGSKTKAELDSHLAGYQADGIDADSGVALLEKNYNISVPNNYYDYFDAVNAREQTKVSAEMPPLDAIWNDKGVSVTFKANPANS